jgi:hypothetical protein
MTVKQYNIEALLSVLRTFTYTTEVDGEAVTVNAEVFTSGQIPIATKIFLQEYGSRVADEILDDYKKGDVTAAELGDMIKTLCVQRWKHFLEMWKVNYNPIWNVDGVEIHEITTEYGKITRMAKGTTITDEQKVDAETEVEYGQKQTDEQKTNGSTSMTYGKSTTTTNPTNTGKVAAMDSVAFVNASESSATNMINTDSGSDSTTTNIGKIEHASSGKDTTTTSIGKVEHAHTGTDTDTLDGSDTTTDTLTRHGNIGVTMTQQLLTAEDDFWSHYSFFTKYFNDIANVISLPIYE